MANENKNALKSALDRLAAAIKDNIGGEAIYPFTIEEMCQTVASANEGEKGKEGFFYYMDKMAYYIAERCGVEPPLTIEEMIEALSVSLISFTIDGTTYQAKEGMTWVEWVNSDYNTNNKYRRGGGMSMYVEETAKRNYYIYDTTTNNCVLLEDIIEVNGVYNTKYVDPVGGSD